MKKIWKYIKNAAKRIKNSLVTALSMVFIVALAILATIVVPVIVLFSKRWDADLQNFYHADE